METEPYPEGIISLTAFNLDLLPGSLLGILVLAILLMCSALISGAEVAYFSLSPNQKNKIRTTKSKSAKNVIRLLDMPDKLLATILIANNLVNVGIVILSAFLSSRLFDFSYSPVWLKFTIEIVIITFLLLFFGEIIPKIYAANNAIKFARLMAGTLVFLQQFFSPLSNLLISSTSRFNKILANKRKTISINDLSDVLEIAPDAISEDKKILEGIVKFGNLYVRDIMRSRIDILAIDIKTKFKELIPVIIESGYSRIPVYVESLDDVKGILYVKDLLAHLHKTNSFKWQSLIRPAYFVPLNKRINDLLEEFQTNKIHLAVVIDEFGGTQGIITMEDILEEIVGEITDETDEEEALYHKIDENTFLFEAKISLNDFYKIVEVDGDIFEEVKGDADTLAGLILEIKGEIPKKGAVVKYKRFNFTVEEADSKRIKKIKMNFI